MFAKVKHSLRSCESCATKGLSKRWGVRRPQPTPPPCAEPSALRTMRTSPIATGCSDSTRSLTNLDQSSLKLRARAHARKPLVGAHHQSSEDWSLSHDFTFPFCAHAERTAHVRTYASLQSSSAGCRQGGLQGVFLLRERVLWSFARQTRPGDRRRVLLGRGGEG